MPAIPAKRRSPKLIMLDSGLTNYVAGIQLEYLQNKDLHTPAPENKPFRLINLPFYYVGQLDRVLEHIEMIPILGHS